MVFRNCNYQLSFILSDFLDILVKEFVIFCFFYLMIKNLLNFYFFVKLLILVMVVLKLKEGNVVYLQIVKFVLRRDFKIMGVFELEE